MTDRYDQVPFDAGPQAAMHPRHLHALAWLHGLDAPDPRTARVLELGVGQGGNLVFVASTLPDAHCVGIDRSHEAIVEAIKRRDEVGLPRLELLEASLEAAEGTFDYVLAHGLYSWVPAPVRDLLMQTVARVLSPNGVACISYNTWPAWDLRALGRRLMMRHAARHSDPIQGARAARRALEVMAHLPLRSEADAFGLTYRSLHEQVTKLPDAWLIHDLISLDNQPVEFLEFARHAADNGLRWLGEAERPSSNIDHLRPDVASAVRALSSDPLEQEQDLDFATGRSLRMSLLCRAEHPVSVARLPERMAALYFASAGPLAPEGGDVRGTSEQTWKLAGGREFRTQAPLVKALMMVLRHAWPQAFTPGELLPRLEEVLGEPVGADLLARALALLLDVDALYMGRRWPLATAAHPHPEVFSMVRALAMAGENNTVNGVLAWVPVDPLTRALVPLVDGRSVEELAAGVAQALRQGRIPVRDPQGRPIDDPAQRALAAGKLTEQVLGRLASLGLLRA